MIYVSRISSDLFALCCERRLGGIVSVRFSFTIWEGCVNDVLATTFVTFYYFDHMLKCVASFFLCREAA